MEHERNLIGQIEIDEQSGLIDFEQYKRLYLLQFQYTFEGHYMKQFDFVQVQKEFTQDRYQVLSCILDLFNIKDEVYFKSHVMYHHDKNYLKELEDYLRAFNNIKIGHRKSK